MNLRAPIILVAVAVAAFALCLPVASQEAPLRLTFLNVGQGDAALLQAPEGQTALIDAGPGVSLLPILRELGVDTLDLLVASHPHADHVGGMAELIETIPVRFYMDNGQAHTTATYAHLISTLTRHTEITYLEAVPRTLSLGSVEIEVLPLLPAETTDLNNRSVGLVLRYGDFSVFLSGDSERRELSHFVQSGVVPDVTVLKAPHHGSDNGFTTGFLDAARPEVVVISVGGNSYGHPRPEAMWAYSSIASHVLRTDQLGHVLIRGFADGRFELETSSALALQGQERGPGPVSPSQARVGVEPARAAVAASAVALSIDVMADAPGNDHQNTNGEYVVISNRAGVSVDIGGWSLCDAASHCFRFPVGASISGSGQVVVFTGSGVSDGSSFFMGSRQAVWNNDGDVATLSDASGAVIVRYRYE